MYELALLVSLVCWVGAVAYYLRLPCFSLFHPLTWYSMVHGLLFVIRPIFGYFLEYDSIYHAFNFIPTVADKTTVIVAANISYLCFFYWALEVGGMPMRFASDRFDAEEKRRLTQIFVWVLVIVVPIGIYSLAKNYGALAGGEVSEGMITDKSTGVQFNTKTSGYVTDAQLLLAPCCALIIWLGRFKPVSWLPLLFFIVIKAGTGGRSPFVLAVIMTALFYCYELRRRLPPARTIWMAAGMMLVFNTIGADRGATIRELMGQQVTYDAGARLDDAKKVKFLEAMDFANMEFFEYVVYVVPQRSGTYDFFLDNFQVFTDPVPRILWNSKPMGEPFRRIWLWDHGTPIGMTRSIPGEGWYALGWVGVVLWSSLWGYGVGYVYRRFVESPQTTMQVACYIIFTGGLLTTYRDGQFLSVVRNSGMYLFPVWIWFLLARYFALPRAAQLRRKAVQLARAVAARSLDGPKEDGVKDAALAGAAGRHAEPTPEMREQAWLESLPPPVRRRRLALQRAAEEGPQAS